ncbi:hypothetical protein BC939DRAFT_58159 [Gamsiella multidivaricata]|uniref:uncharacterized protein n=1 Tax=Gamsiella multidivaricata TaxID=101098 RepID=UPI00221EE282|nr:uncharacterized protein BC939DRAFT_58159 [Gamsiella multidivaricata]KAI7816167.1 hypothetical protein BC939DRAFT_58159 [Gamsiella multidivaricata]
MHHAQCNIVHAANHNNKDPIQSNPIQSSTRSYPLVYSLFCSKQRQSQTEVDQGGEGYIRCAHEQKELEKGGLVVVDRTRSGRCRRRRREGGEMILRGCVMFFLKTGVECELLADWAQDVPFLVLVLVLCGRDCCQEGRTVGLRGIVPGVQHTMGSGMRWNEKRAGRAEE